MSAKSALVSTPIGATSATAKQLVNRLLGRTNEAVQRPDVFAKILESGKATQSATVYSHLGRALVFLNRGEDKLAKADVALAEQASNKQVAQKLIASLDFQVKARLLDEEVRKLTISGATTEGDVATHVAAVEKALLRVTEVVGGEDVAFCLAAGEFYLRYGNDAKQAATYFEKAVSLSQNTVCPPLPTSAAPAAVAAAAVDAQSAPMPSIQNSHVTVGSVVADSSSLKALESTFGPLGEQELTHLGSVLATESRGGVVYDAVNTNSEEFKAWTSPAAAHITARVEHIVHPLLPMPTSAKVSKPTQVFYKDGKKVSELIKTCPSDVHILDYIKRECGPAPSVQISESDASFFDALKSIEGDATDTAPVESSQASRYYTKLANDLLAQVNDRAKVGLAEAYTKLDKTDEAAKLLKEVRSRDTYVDMWRQLLAQGELAKKVGKVEDADKAFKELHGLKVQRGSNDLPLMDANRYKSAF